MQKSLPWCPSPEALRHQGSLQSPSAPWAQLPAAASRRAPGQRRPEPLPAPAGPSAPHRTAPRARGRPGFPGHAGPEPPQAPSPAAEPAAEVPRPGAARMAADAAEPQAWAAHSPWPRSAGERAARFRAAADIRAAAAGLARLSATKKQRHPPAGGRQRSQPPSPAPPAATCPRPGRAGAERAGGAARGVAGALGRSHLQCGPGPGPVSRACRGGEILAPGPASLLQRRHQPAVGHPQAPASLARTRCAGAPVWSPAAGALRNAARPR